MQKVVLLSLLVLIIMIIFTGCSSSIKAVTNPQLPLPTDKNELIGYLEHFVPEQYSKKDFSVTIDESSNLKGSYLVNLELHSDKINEEQALNLARDFIFATFKASTINKLPIIYASASINTTNDKRIILIGVGSNVIQKISLDTLKSGNMDAFDFAQWVELNQKQNEINGKIFYDGRCIIKRP